MKLILIRGIPGSGKTTFASVKFSGVFHLENDMYHVKNGKYSFDPHMQDNAISWCMDMCRTALALGMDCVVSNTFTKKKYIEAYARIADEFNADFEVYRMCGEFGNIHSVPEDVFANMKKNFEDWPSEIMVDPIGPGRLPAFEIRKNQ